MGPGEPESPAAIAAIAAFATSCLVIVVLVFATHLYFEPILQHYLEMMNGPHLRYLQSLGHLARPWYSWRGPGSSSETLAHLARPWHG